MGKSTARMQIVVESMRDLKRPVNGRIFTGLVFFGMKRTSVHWIVEIIFLWETRMPREMMRMRRE